MVSVGYYKVGDSFVGCDVAFSYSHDASELSVLELLLVPLTISRNGDTVSVGRVRLSPHSVSEFLSTPTSHTSNELLVIYASVFDWVDDTAGGSWERVGENVYGITSDLGSSRMHYYNPSEWKQYFSTSQQWNSWLYLII